MGKVHIEFYSECLGRQIDVGAFLPEEYGETGARKGNPIKKDFPVLYLLHGYNSDFSTWERMTQIGFMLRDLPLTVVMPSGLNSYYVDGRLTNMDYYRFLNEELPGKIKNWFPISDKREDTFVGGLSLGGYGAMRLSLANPERFSYAFTLSGVVDLEGYYNDTCMYKKCIIHDRDISLGCREDALNTDNDIFYLIDKNIREGKEFPRLMLACGTNDPAYHYTANLLNKLRETGVDVEYFDKEGKHDWNFWNYAIKRIFEWLPLDRYRG